MLGDNRCHRVHSQRRLKKVPFIIAIMGVLTKSLRRQSPKQSTTDPAPTTSPAVIPAKAGILTEH